MALPPVPSWDALHPVVVHFPIALLLTLPVFIVLGLIIPRGARAFSVSALVLMLIGTGAMLLALSTGEAAEHRIVETPAIDAAVEDHEDLAKTARTVFLVLTGAFAALMLAAWRAGARFTPRAFRIASVVFLVPYAAGMLILANVGHTGGRLVHELGVQAAPLPTAGTAAAPARERDED